MSTFPIFFEFIKGIKFSLLVPNTLESDGIFLHRFRKRQRNGAVYRDLDAKARRFKRRDRKEKECTKEKRNIGVGSSIPGCLFRVLTVRIKHPRRNSWLNDFPE